MGLDRSADQPEHGQGEEKVRRHLKGKDEGKRYKVASESARKKAAIMLPRQPGLPLSEEQQSPQEAQRSCFSLCCRYPLHPEQCEQGF